MNRFKNKFLSVMLSAAMVAGMLSPMGVQAKAISSGDEYLTTADGQKVKITVQYGGTSETIGVLEGDMATVVDGNAETGVNFRGNASGYADDGIQVGDYIQVEYEEAITLENAVFTFKSGSTDIFQKSTFSYSLDGTEWVDAATIESSTVMIYKAAEAIEGVKAIRLTNDEYIRKWLNLNEISVNQDLPYIWNSTESKLGYEKVSGTATAPSAASEELEGPGNGIVAAATDESKNTFWHSSYSNDETDLRNGGGTAASEYSYIEVALAEATDLAGVTYMPRQLSGYDYSNGAFKTFKVQVKTADGEWTDADIASINGNEVTTADFSGTDLEGNEVTAAGPYVTVDYAEKQPNEELEVFFKDVQKDITAVKFVVKESFGTSDTQYNQFLNAAEISGLKAKAEEPEVPAEPEFDIEVSDRVKDMIVNMSLRDKVTQMLMVDFRMWDTDTTDTVARTDFTVMNDQVRKIVEDYNFGSVIYFANNIKTTEDTFALTQEMQAAATKDGGIALLIAADQEGGSVYRLGSGTALPGNMALGATFNTDNAYKAGKIIGSELGILGINTNLAPVVDVNNNANNPVIGLRSYGDDATAVGEMAAASIAGMAEYNVIGTAKHFPGHGDTATDSHYGLPMVDKSLDVLKEVELKPYEVAIEEGIEMIMTAHILYPQLESDKIVSKKTGEAESLPATMSDDILTGLLKEDMGFDGIIVTDAMNMAGISDKWDQVQSVVIAFQAGVDMICMPCQLYSMDDLANLDAIIDGVVAAAEAGEIPMSRIDSAVARILNVKENRGILDYKAEDYTLEAAKATVGSAENRQTEREIAAAAVTVVKNENNVLPLDIKEDTNVLMLVPYNNERSQMLMAWNRAKEAGLIPEGAEVDYYTFSRYTTMETADFAEKLAWANIVIINSEISSAAKMAGANTTAALTSTTFLAAIPTWVTDYCKENGKISVISSVDKPYDVQLYPNADAIVAAYGCKGSSVDPTEALIGGVTGSEAAYGPNIIAAVEVALGTFPAQGKLPVTIPVFDAATKTYTEEVAFERGYGLTYDAKEPLPEVEPVDKSGLETMVADAKAGDYSSKTEESVAALNAAIEAAEAVLANEAATQEEVDEAKAALVAAVIGLQDKPVEPDVTDPADASKDVPTDMYTATAGSTQPGNSPNTALDENPGSFWEVVWDIGNTDPSVMWYQIELADEVEIDAVRYLPRWGGDAGNINGFVTQYLIQVSTDGENWTDAAEGTWERTEGWKIAEFEAVTAKYVRLTGVGTWADVGENSNMSIAEIRVRATGEVINKGALKAAIAKAENLVKEDYVDLSGIEAPLAAAKAVADKAEATQEEVDAAAAALNEALDALVKVVKKDALKAAIADAKAVDQSLYTSKTAKALANAIEAGEDLVDDETATQEVVDAATAAITKAKAALVAKATAEEKAALAEAVEAAEAMDTSAYTEESVAALDEAIAAAKAVLDDADATSKDVKDAADDLQDAVDALEIPVVEDEVVRLFGQGRYDTAYAVADALKEALGVEKFEAVVVATGKNFADALAGSYLAVEKNAPILLTNGNDENVAQLHAYIKANVAEGGKVYILGGDGAVPTTVDVIDGYEVERLFGDSRYDTNLAILEEAGVTGDSVIVATGKTFADSLSASAAKLPILLVKPDGTLNDAQKAILTGMKNIYIVGGDGAVSTGYEAELKEFGEVTRVFGESRYDTSVEVAKTFCKDVTKAVVASGKNFPDGLCGGPLAAALNAPLVLTKDGGTDAAAAYVAENGIAGGYVLGGDGALTDATVVEVFALTGAEEIK